jgi:replication factor C subunit 3/5
MSNPWVEKYRPITLENVVLDKFNEQIIENIIKKGYFPNLLLYGPPGTGKTTTIINLLNTFQKKYNQENKELIIHLNASDERGIDIIRNQIQQFINSKNMFNKGMKFVVLDEVDYMTKAAQQALRQLMQTFNNNVRFCLICNYISRIDENLQNEFLRLRFNDLPKQKVIFFLQNIVKNENLTISDEKIEQIQKFYKSDLRSMINFLQSNQDGISVITTDIWNELLEVIRQQNVKDIVDKINHISLTCNTDVKSIVKDFLNFLIVEHNTTSEFLNFVENIVHNEVKNSRMLNYFAYYINNYV